MEKVITDEPTERIVVKYDGTRFALVKTRGDDDAVVIILNPQEAMELANFIKEAS